MYKDLVPADTQDKRVADAVRYAKETARAAGYPLSGRNLDQYTFHGARYLVEAKAYENSGYYMVLLNPEGLPETSHNLEISIEKKRKRVITILQGG